MEDRIREVGHSNGGAFVAYIARHRPVKHLVLVGPNLTVQPGDKLFKRLLGTPNAFIIDGKSGPVF